MKILIYIMILLYWFCVGGLWVGYAFYQVDLLFPLFLTLYVLTRSVIAYLEITEVKNENDIKKTS